MLTITSCLWQPRDNVRAFSKCYTPEWVDKLFRGFARNLTIPFRFVCFTDREYDFKEPIGQHVDETLGVDGYGSCIRPFGLNVPMIFAGLDTVVTGNVDHLAEYAMSQSTLCLHRDPYSLDRAGNGVALVPAGHGHIATTHNGENDMEWLRKQSHVFADDLWPGHVVSYKGHVKACGVGDARLVYFHGNPKMHDLLSADWVMENWK